MSVETLQAENFDGALASSELPLVVDFWAPWCGPCRTMAPAFETAANNFNGRARFAKVNVDDAPGLARRFAVRAIPTLVLFKGGQEIKRVSGTLDARSLASWMNA